MISREQPFYNRNLYSEHSGKYHGSEETLKTAQIQVERKIFTFTLKENPRGRFLRITEDVGGRRDTIILPATGIVEFKRVIDDMLKSLLDSPQ